MTHAHADHFGLAKKLTEADIDVSVHTDEETRATGRYRGRFAVTPRELPVFRPAVLVNFLTMVVRGIMQLEHVDGVDTFSDGDRIDLPGRPVVIHTPGHTEGHVMFHVPERGMLFTGDGLANVGSAGRQPPHRPGGAGGSVAARARQSLVWLAGRCGGGGPHARLTLDRCACMTRV